MNRARTIVEQFEFSFDAGAASDGLLTWREARARDLQNLCQQLGMPIDKEVEVTLARGLVLRGVLQLPEETLWIEARRETVVFQIGVTTFCLADIESVLRV